MNSKHLKRVLSEFEEILFTLSKENDVTYQKAEEKAKEYISEFSIKKNLPLEERSFLFNNCVDMIQDWFPDTTLAINFMNF